MTPKRKILRRFVCLCMALVLCLSFAACRNTGNDQTTEDTNAPDVTYTLQIQSEGGMAMPDLEIYIYENDTLQDLVAVTATDAEGTATFTAKKSDTYVAVLVNAPSGYAVESSYPITGADTRIVLEMELVAGDLSTAVYALGDVMQDFSFTDYNGNSYKLSELLQSKKAVVLNFFRLDGVDSQMELPCLQEAYEKYAESVAVLCMNPVDGDNDAIAEFAKSLDLTLPMGACEAEWVNAMQIFSYPTTVVIDRFGTVAMNHGQAVTQSYVFTDVFSYFIAEDYVQSTVTNIDDLVVSEPDEGVVENPNEIVGGIMEFDLTLEAGKIHYVRIPNVDNVWMQVASGKVNVEYGGKTFQPSGDSVGLFVSAPSTFEPAVVGFRNVGSERITFHVSMSNLPGTYENPYSLKIGDFSASVSGNDTGVYFKYQATEDGYFSLMCKAVSSNAEHTYSILNLTNSTMYSLEEDSAVNEQGYAVVTAPVKKGQSLLITINTLPDDANKYPAATFQMSASFRNGEVADVEVVEEVSFAITVTDENRKPLAGVNVGFIPENPTDLNKGANWETDENGVASGYLPKDNYTVSAVVPNGYKATTTQAKLTPEEPYASLKFDTYVVVMCDYSVSVTDEQGNALPDALVVIGSASGYTNDRGVFTANLEKGDYTAVVQKNGYEIAEQSFATGSTVLNVKLKASSGDVQNGVDYTVTVTDYTGTPMTGITVSLYRYGVLSGMAAVDDNGVATFRLRADNYTVGLTSTQGVKLKYAEASLTAKAPSATVQAAVNGNTGDRETIFWGSYYEIGTGSTWADLTDNTNATANMSWEALADFQGWAYVFVPKQAGVYRFTVSDGALLAYFGSTQFPNLSMDTSVAEKYFEIEVRQANVDEENGYVVAVKSTSGADSAVISVQRMGDVPAELPTVYYSNKVTPTAFKLNQSGTLHYVDVTAAGTVERRNDGFYYLNGKKLYMNIGKSAPYITVAEMVGLSYNETTGGWDQSSMATGLKGYQIENGETVAVEQYNGAIKEYIQNCDPSNGLYPVTDDLAHILQKTGEYRGWWEQDDPDYLFGSKSVNTDIAWLFACCTVE